LEREGLIARTVFPTKTPSVEYRRTPLGVTILEPLGHLTLWANGSRVVIMKTRLAFDETGRVTAE
jgi:DNA-binding HxlR family transcriptional regulator